VKDNQNGECGFRMKDVVMEGKNDEGRFQNVVMNNKEM